MKRSLFAVLALSSLSLAACASHVDSTADGATSSETDDVKAYKPIPFVLQYVGTYEPKADGGDLAALELRRNGKYVATLSDGSVEHGSWRGPSKIPTGGDFVIKLFTTGFAWSATVSTAWGANMTIDRGDGPEAFVPTYALGTEDMCDSTGGSWTDDDADPKTGLFCVCPAKKSFIPSAGGCVK